jgi:MFS family permease
LLLVTAGLSTMIQLGSTNTLIQSIVSNAMRGRVMGIYLMMFLGMAPFGSLIAGFLAQHLGAPAAVFCCGAASIAGAIVFEIRRKHLRIDDHLSRSAHQAQADTRR